MQNHRRVATVSERLQPCECCGYRPVEWHHVFSFVKYGHSGITIPLCANCHFLYHLIVSANESENIKSQQVLTTLLQDKRFEEQLFWPLYSLSRDAKKVEAEFNKMIDTAAPAAQAVALSN